MPDLQTGRQASQHKVALTPQVKQYSTLNYREILTHCLEWKSIDEFNVHEPELGLVENTPRLAETSLLDKYDFHVASKESENANLYKLREEEALAKKNAKKGTTTPVMKPVCEQAPDSCLPPFQAVKNEPFGESSLWQTEEIIGKLGEVADSTIQFGESLFKKIFRQDERPPEDTSEIPIDSNNPYFEGNAQTANPDVKAHHLKRANTEQVPKTS